MHFLLARDDRGVFRFAMLQGDAAARILPRHGYDPDALDTVHVVADWNTPGERVLVRSRAVLHALRELGGGWSVLGRVGAFVPTTVADVVYHVVARNRYRIFGRFDSCQLPPSNVRDRFLDRSQDRDPDAGGIQSSR